MYMCMCQKLIMQIWSLQGGVCELTLHGHEAAVSCLQFDETRIISGALDRLIKIWNITNGEVHVYNLNGNKNSYDSMHPLFC